MGTQKQHLVPYETPHTGKAILHANDCTVCSKGEQEQQQEDVKSVPTPTTMELRHLKAHIQHAYPHICSR